MDIIPVLDLMHGLVVRGVAGQRDSYQPIQSCLTKSSTAADVASAIHQTFGFTKFYVADLDAIVSDQPNQQLIDELTAAGFTLMLDVGVRSVEHLRSIKPASNTSVIIALESIESLDTVAAALDQLGSERIIFSLDLKHGNLLGHPTGLKSGNPERVVDQVVDLGVHRVILLDLAAVGMGTGIPTLDLCELVRAQHPELQIITGGGVSCTGDLKNAYQASVNGLLIASALHDGRVVPADLATIETP